MIDPLTGIRRLSPRKLGPLEIGTTALTVVAVVLSGVQAAGETCNGTVTDPNPPFCSGNFTPCENIVSGACPARGEEDCSGVTGEYPVRVNRFCTVTNPYYDCVNGYFYSDCAEKGTCSRHPDTEECEPRDLCSISLTTDYKINFSCEDDYPDDY